METISKARSTREYWQSVYRGKSPTELIWYQAVPEGSLRLVEQTGAKPGSHIIDVGGGTSNLAGYLLDRGYTDLAVLDISAHALEAAIRQLGPEAAHVRWIEADITRYEFREQFDVWHDRAVFHFLTDSEDRRAYVHALGKAIKPGGHVIISTFGVDGPQSCSGLSVERYSPVTLSAELGSIYGLVESRKEMHSAPTGEQQHFIYCLFRKKD